MFAAVLIALSSFVSGSWVDLFDPGEQHETSSEVRAQASRDHLARPDAPGVELVEPADWTPPPASSLRRPDSPQESLMRVDELRQPTEGYEGLHAPERHRRRLDSLQAPESANDSLSVPDPELLGEPLLQRPSTRR